MPNKKPKQKRVTATHGGLGTDIANVIEKTGIKKVVELFVDGKDCGCADREKALNEILPKRYTARCMTEKEYNEYKAFREVRTLLLLPKQARYICELYHAVFQLKGNVFYDCLSGCSPKPFIKKIDLLDQVFESYEKELV